VLDFPKCRSVQFLHHHLLMIHNPTLSFLSFFLALTDTLYIQVKMAIYSINNFIVHGTRTKATKSENFR